MSRSGSKKYEVVMGLSREVADLLQEHRAELQRDKPGLKVGLIKSSRVFVEQFRSLEKELAEYRKAKPKKVKSWNL